MRIRRIGSADLGALLEFYLSLSPEVVFFYEPFHEVDEARLADHLAWADAGHHYDLALVDGDGRIMGHCYMQGWDGDKPTLGLGLRDEIIGQGWGRRLLETIVAEMDRQGVPKLYLTVVKANERAWRLYESVGFAVTGSCTFRSPDDSYEMERIRPAGPGKE